VCSSDLRLDEDDLPLDVMNEIMPSLWIGDARAPGTPQAAEGVQGPPGG
jgi:hypothetical protein